MLDFILNFNPLTFFILIGTYFRFLHRKWIFHLRSSNIPLEYLTQGYGFLGICCSMDLNIIFLP